MSLLAAEEEKIRQNFEILNDTKMLEFRKSKSIKTTA
jgi:hypothetical protein